MTEQSQQVTVIEQNAAPAVAEQSAEHGANAIMRLIERAALDPNFDVAKLDHLLAVKERWDANEARKAFIAAKAAFKAEAPVIDKNKHVGFDSRRSDSRTDYDHATLDHIEELISPILSKHGLAYSWDVQQGDQGRITVTCTMTHVLGHSERVSLTASPDTTGNKNSIQAIGSTITYLERYTLLAITGLSTGGQDDDGAAAGKGKTISPEQKDQLVTLIRETNTDTTKFLKALELGPSVDQIPADRFVEAQNALLTKKRQQAKARGEK